MKRILGICFLAVLAFAPVGCKQKEAKSAAGMQAMPVKTVPVDFQPVAQGSEYVATVKSRRSATLQPQVSGRLVQIQAHSGERVRAGQPLMEIDSQPQMATVQAQKATQQQKKALYDYDTTELERQRKLFEAGVTSREAFDQAQQAYNNAKADYESSVALSKTQEAQLAYYTIRAPFDGVVGDIPVRVGDYVSSSTVLTTVDENKDLEAYIYVPTDRASEVKLGLGVELYDTSGKLLEQTRIDFVSPQVDSNLQGILVKAPVHATPDMVRNAQLIKARVIWGTKPMAVVPVLAVSRLGGQSFVYVMQKVDGKFVAKQVAITLGDTVGNMYSVISGLNKGDQIIVSSTQFLANGMPVMPLGA